MTFKPIVGIGIAVGSFLLQAVFPKQKTKSEPGEPKANYGDSISRVFGTHRLSTSLTYASKLRERTGKGGGGKGKNASKGLFGDFQVVIGEGERPAGFVDAGSTSANLGQLTLQAIFFNKEEWWSASKTGSENSSRAAKFEFYPGSFTQIPDPTLVSALGAANVPPYQGISHIVFTDVDVAQDSNGNYPVVEVLVTASLPTNSNVVIEDIMARAGINNSRPLQRYAHYTDSTARADSSITNQLADGFVVEQQSANMGDYLGQAILISDLIAFNGTADATDYGSATDYCTLRVQGRTLVDEVIQAFLGNINFTLFGESLPPLIEVEENSEEENPSALSIRYINQANNYERASIRVDHPYSSSGETQNITIDAPYTNPNVPLAIGRRVLFEGATAKARYKASNLRKDAKISDFLTVENFQERALGDLAAPLLSGQFGRINQSRYTQIVLGANGLTETTFVENVAQAVGSYTNLPEPNDQTNSNPDVNGYPDVVWFEGAKTLWIDAAPTVPTVNLILARELGTSANPNDFSVYSTTDSGATFNFATTVTGTNAVRIPAATISQTPPIRALEGAIDRTTTITVAVDPSVAFESIDESQIFDPLNTLFFKDWGFVRFATATLVASNQYVLSDLLWNVFDSYELSSTLPLGSGRLSAPVYYLESPIHYVPVSTAVAVGSSYVLGVEVDGVNSNLATGSFVAPAESDQVYNGYTSAPRPIQNFTSTILPSGEWSLTWDSGESQTSFTPLALFGTPTPTTDNYLLNFYESGTLLGQLSSTGSTRTITTAEIAGLVITNLANVTVRIIESDTISLSFDNAFDYPII